MNKNVVETELKATIKEIENFNYIIDELIVRHRDGINKVLLKEYKRRIEEIIDLKEIRERNNVIEPLEVILKKQVWLGGCIENDGEVYIINRYGDCVFSFDKEDKIIKLGIPKCLYYDIKMKLLSLYEECEEIILLRMKEYIKNLYK